MAELLGQPQATYATKITAMGANQLTVVRDLDAMTQTVELTLPAVATVRAELNVPRYETPIEIQASFDKPMTVMTDQDLDLDPARLGQAGSPTKVRKIYEPAPVRREAKRLGDTAEAAVDSLLAIMQGQGLL